MTLIGGGGFLILGFLIIFLLFLGFYFISAYMVCLEEPLYVSVKKGQDKENENIEEINKQDEKQSDNEEVVDIYSN